MTNPNQSSYSYTFCPLMLKFVPPYKFIIRLNRRRNETFSSHIYIRKGSSIQLQMNVIAFIEEAPPVAVTLAAT